MDRLLHQYPLKSLSTFQDMVLYPLFFYFFFGVCYKGRKREADSKRTKRERENNKTTFWSPRSPRLDPNMSLFYVYTTELASYIYVGYMNE